MVHGLRGTGLETWIVCNDEMVHGNDDIGSMVNGLNNFYNGWNKMAMVMIWMTDLLLISEVD